MKQKNKFASFLLSIIVIAVLLFVQTFFDEKAKDNRTDLRLYYGFGILALSIGVILEEHIKKVWQSIPLVKKLFGKERDPDIVLTDTEINTLKKQVLLFTKSQCKIKLSSIIGPEMIGGEFPIDPDFMPGVSVPNDNNKWKDFVGEQFSFITGEKGSGKSIELINRVDFYSKQLDKGIEKPEFLHAMKVPLYVELKSLDKKLDKEWMVDYVYKSAIIAKIKLDKNEIKWLLDKGQVVYFFDGLDEVLPDYRKSTVQVIVDLATKTGVTVSCRKDLFEKLKKQDAIPERQRPAEWLLKPLTLDWIMTIIDYMVGYSSEQKQQIIHFMTSVPNVLDHLSRPILFNLFVLTFPHLTQEEKERLEHADFGETLKILWSVYEDIIVRKKLAPDTDVLNMRTYTVWLARIMGDRSFFVESIQPSWLVILDKNNKVLQSKILQRLFYLITRIVAAVVVGVAMGCIIATPFALISDSIVGGIMIAAVAGVYGNSKRIGISSNVAEKLFPAFMLASLILACGIFQGFSVPRLPDGAAFSMSETWPGILLGLALGTIFSYRIILEKNRMQYILPVEVFHFDWFHAVRYGFSWGVISALMVGTIAVLVKITEKNKDFIEGWLIPQVREIGSSFNYTAMTDLQVNWGVFIYGFFATFMVASLIITVLAGRFSDGVEETDKKQKLNYAIKESFRHALNNSIKVGIICAVFYVGFTFKFDMVDIVHSVTFPLGMFLLAFLWFGGMEGFNHILLRINLYIRGIAPEDYEPWVQAHENMGLIIPTGFQMKFYHPTLAEYYKDYSLEEQYDVPRLRLKRTKVDYLIYLIALFFCGLVIVIPFHYRYSGNIYWKSRHEVISNFNKFEITKLADDSTYVVLKDGRFTISASGFINVGTFVGWVWPWGTESGFMGMKMGKSYNLTDSKVEKLRHAALLFRIAKNDSSWGPYNYVAKSSAQSFVDTLLKKGQRIQFVINDREFQNNKGHFRVNIIWNDLSAKINREISGGKQKEEKKEDHDVK